LFLAEQVAAAGFGRIVMSSRSQPTLKALETIEIIRAIGADVVVQYGDIVEVSTAERLVAAATAHRASAARRVARGGGGRAGDRCCAGSAGSSGFPAPRCALLACGTGRAVRRIRENHF
jgi:hypothetical protein